MARSCHGGAHFRFEDLKRAGHRDQIVLAYTKMMNLSKWLERLGEVTFLYGAIILLHPALWQMYFLAYKWRWLVQHRSCPKWERMPMRGICKIFFTTFNSCRKSAYYS